MRQRLRGLPALLLAFAALAGVYSLATPVLEGPDEIWHFAFASHLADGGGLPVVDAAAPNLLLRNALHPPLYYLPVAGLIAPVDRQDFPAQFRFNLASPHITPGSTSDRPNLLIHTRHEDWPYRQSVLAVHLGRLVSIVLGGLALGGVYAGTRRLVPGGQSLALLATGLAAFVPQFVYGSAMLNNDALAAAAGAWILVALLGLMQALSLRWAMLAGVLLGVGFLAKIGMVALLPLPAVALALVVLGDRPGWPLPGDRPAAPTPAAGLKPSHLWRQALGAGALVYGPATLVAGWWYVRNWRLYGDPLAWREWQALAGAQRSGLTMSQFLSDLAGLFGTFWADFGLRADRQWAWAFATLVVVALLGLGWRWRRRQWPPLYLPGLVVGVVWFGLLLASAVRYSLAVTDIHGRLLYPALTVVALALALGLTAWGPRLAAGAVVGFLAFATAVPFVLIRPAYARPVVAGGALPAAATPVAASFGQAVELAGYSLGDVRLEPGDALQVTAYWSPAPGAQDLPDAHAIVVLTRPDGKVLGRSEGLLGSSVYPSSVWVPGDLIQWQAEVPVDLAAEAPVVADVMLGVRGAGDTLLTGPQGELVSLGRVAVSTGTGCSPPANAGQSLGGQVRLLGYVIDAHGVTLCWEALQPINADYTVFVHIFDAGAVGPSAFGDGQPRGGLYPTSAWQPGERVEDWHPVEVPQGARVEVGLYRLDTGERLTIDGTDQTSILISN